MSEIDLSPIVPVLLELLGGLLLALGGVAIHRLSRWLRLKEDSETRAYIEAALPARASMSLINVPML